MTAPGAPRKRSLALWLTGMLAALCLVSLVTLQVGPRTAAAQTIEIVVPSGTQAQIDGGEEIVLFPRRLEVGVGDRIVIANEDAATHQVGPYIVGPGQQIVQTFAGTGVIEGICTLHPSGEVTIVVR